MRGLDPIKSGHDKPKKQPGRFELNAISDHDFKQPNQDTRSHSRGTILRPSDAEDTSLEKNRGRRECRALDAPIASRVNEKQTHELVTTGSPKHSGIPRASGFNGL
jgi:hypothetical protein